MNVDTIIIIIAIFTAQSVPLALFLNLSKKIDVLKDEIINLKLELKDTNHRINNIESSVKDINTNLYLINERLNILGFSNKTNGVHPSKEQELEYN